jgi:hypothetical protein
MWRGRRLRERGGSCDIGPMTTSTSRWAAAALTLASISCADPDPEPELPPAATYHATWGPVVVEPGVERTECVVVDLGNETAIDVHRFHNTLALGSHHLVVYRDNEATGPSPAPFECTPFAGTVSSSAARAPMMITQKHDEELVLPPGVAYHLEPHQMIRLEIHYINTTDAPLSIDASVELDTTTTEPIENHADFLFIGTPDISLPPGAHTSVEAFFRPPETLADAQYFAITGHTHQYGVDVRVGYAPDRDVAPTSVYAPDPFRWNDPDTAVHTPAFQVPTGGGFAFTCEYMNTSTETVEFGESANDEMCFFWAYYYPSRGAHVCAHTDEIGAEGLDVCCPAEPGDALSEFLCDKLAEEL